MSVEVIEIPLDKIAPPLWNSRLELDEDSVKELAASMAGPAGQINAITVEPLGEPSAEGCDYAIVTGWRRWNAAKLNGWKKIRATVGKPLSAAERIGQNVVENLQRKDLTLYEQARAVAEMRRAGMKGPQITELTGYSKSKISKLTAMFEKIPEQIHGAWQNKHRAATFDFMADLAAIEESNPEKTKEAQLEAWDERVKLVGLFEGKLNPPDPCEETRGCILDKGHDGDCKKKLKKAKSDKEDIRKVPYARMLDIGRALKKVPGGALAISAMRALVGDTDSIKGVWSGNNKETQ